MRTIEVTTPLTNENFLHVIENSFCAFLEKGTSRSTDKLKPLHGKIAEDIANILGCEYSVYSQGYENGKEKEIRGRYYSKKVDIVILHKGKTIAGIGVKFIQQNYSQNSNNYFENMLGETANIRTTKIPYFQIFIIPDTLPYYEKEKSIKKWEDFSSHNASKYGVLSQDNTDVYYHTPKKTLIYVIHIPMPLSVDSRPKNQDGYISYYRTNDINVTLSKTKFSFGDTVILNDYETFRTKVYHTIMAL